MKKLLLILIFCTSFVEKPEESKGSDLTITDQTELDSLRIIRNRNRVLLSKKELEYVEAGERLSNAINK